MKCDECSHLHTDSSDDPFVPSWVSHSCTKTKYSTPLGDSIHTQPKWCPLLAEPEYEDDGIVFIDYIGLINPRPLTDEERERMDNLCAEIRELVREKRIKIVPYKLDHIGYEDGERPKIYNPRGDG